MANLAQSNQFHGRKSECHNRNLFQTDPIHYISHKDDGLGTYLQNSARTREGLETKKKCVYPFLQYAVLSVLCQSDKAQALGFEQKLRQHSLVPNLGHRGVWSNNANYDISPLYLAREASQQHQYIRIQPIDL